jgi:dihydroorotase
MDFLIKNGTIYDPAQHKTWKGDIALVDGKLAAPSENYQYRQVIDAEGCIVTSGLIDYHVHYMRGASEGGVLQRYYDCGRRRNCRNRNV